MSKSKKKKYIIRGILITIVLIISVKIIYKDKLYQKIHSCKKYYGSDWRLERWSINIQEENLVYISFSLKDFKSDNVLNSISDTYEAIVYTFLEEPKSKYKDYSLQIEFRDIDVAFIIFVDGKDQSIDVLNSFYDISIADISTYFPQTESLTLLPAKYESIEEIDGFTDLKEISFSQKMTAEEKEYIQSVFPNCYIDPSYIRDGAIYYDTEE